MKNFEIVSLVQASIEDKKQTVLDAFPSIFTKDDVILLLDRLLTLVDAIDCNNEDNDEDDVVEDSSTIISDELLHDIKSSIASECDDIVTENSNYYDFSISGSEIEVDYIYMNADKFASAIVDIIRDSIDNFNNK